MYYKYYYKKPVFIKYNHYTIQKLRLIFIFQFNIIILKIKYIYYKFSKSNF
jgi:hypothetical protein